MGIWRRGMLKDFYDIESEPIVTYEAFYGPKKHIADQNDIELMMRAMVIGHCPLYISLFSSAF
jgi:hypothetical protein